MESRVRDVERASASNSISLAKLREEFEAEKLKWDRHQEATRVELEHLVLPADEQLQKIVTVALTAKLPKEPLLRNRQRRRSKARSDC